MASNSTFIDIGHHLLKGGIIEDITLRGKTYKFNYTDTEFFDCAVAHGWPDEFAKRCAEEYELAKVDYNGKRTSRQAAFICNTTDDFCLNSGGFGCLDGDTKITVAGQGEVTIKDLYEKGKSFKVISHKKGKAVYSIAVPPVRYPKAKLFRVTLENGKSIVATAKHRFLTSKGWTSLNEVSVGELLLGYEPSLQDSISDTFQSTLFSGALRLIYKLRDFLFCCPIRFRSNGGRLRSGVDSDLISFQRQVGALEHIHQNYVGDVGLPSLEYNRACLQCVHHAKNDSSRVEKHLPALSVVNQNEASVSGRTFVKSQAREKSLSSFFSRHITSPTVCNICSSQPYPTITKTRIQSIEFEKVDNYYDFHVIGTNNYLAQGVFHHNSGKSIALYVKMILAVKCWPGNRVLMGRKTLSDIDRAVLPELFQLLHPSWYEHRVKDGLININNGSQIILFGLDAMQSGNIADIKKAQQKLKSLNLGAYFIDQLEEVEYEVFEVLNSRLRRNESPFRQGNMDCNPANFWAYHQFKLGEAWNGDVWLPSPENRSKLYESSMLHNPNLPWDYIRKQLAMGDAYVNRFVKGTWDTSIMLKGKVFADEHIKYQRTFIKAPIAISEGCHIWEEPRVTDYRMGVDPSEGVTDPSSISIVSSEGKLVAMWNGMIPMQGLIDKVKFLYYKYNKPLIIPESNTGAALIREIRDLKVYKRKLTDEKWDKETAKLGFRMSPSSKQQLIEHFSSLLRKRAPKIFDKSTLDEMDTFLWNDEPGTSGAGASRGFHDDRVISTLLAFWDWTPAKQEQLFLRQTQAPVVKKKFQYS